MFKGTKQFCVDFKRELCDIEDVSIEFLWSYLDEAWHSFPSISDKKDCHLCTSIKFVGIGVKRKVLKEVKKVDCRIESLDERWHKLFNLIMFIQHNSTLRNHVLSNNNFL